MKNQDRRVNKISGKLEASTIRVSSHEYLNMMISTPTRMVTDLNVCAIDVVRPSETT